MTAMPPDEAGDGDQEPERRCGFIALIGAPNAGKSTLLNTLVGTKVAIVSPRVQTTRSRVLGIAISNASQLVFVDTPGIFRPRRRLERAMVAAAWKGAEDADLIVLLADATERGVSDETRDIMARLNEAGRSAILALNKVDAVRRSSLLALAQALNAEGRFSDTFMISALTGDGVADLTAALAGRVPSGPWLFPEDEITDMPMRLMAAEVTREKLFLQLRQELPYALAVETETWEEFQDGSVRIAQVITVQRDSQKAIVLGKGGRMIRTVGESSRRELEEAFERRVHLSLFVRVRPDWIDDRSHYRDWGLDYDV